MSPAALTVVADNALPQDDAPPREESLSIRVRRLQTEARTIAREHVQALEDALHDLARLAAEIAEGGEAYPVGARQLASQMIGDCQGRASTLDAILARTAPQGRA